VALSDELDRIAEAARRFAEPGEELTGVLATEPGSSTRVYLCAYRGNDGGTSWLALDDHGEPVEQRGVLRDAVSIAALCELADDIAGGGDLDELRSQLVALRITEAPPGVEDAEEALLALQNAIGSPPHVATPERLDAVGAATRRLEQTLDGRGGSPFAEAMRQATATVEELLRDVESSYKRELR
jgi:hypothetical protein